MQPNCSTSSSSVGEFSGWCDREYLNREWGEPKMWTNANSVQLMNYFESYIIILAMWPHSNPFGSLTPSTHLNQKGYVQRVWDQKKMSKWQILTPYVHDEIYGNIMTFMTYVGCLQYPGFWRAINIVYRACMFMVFFQKKTQICPPVNTTPYPFHSSISRPMATPPNLARLISNGNFFPLVTDMT